ncbi:unnamed protein product [Phytophthora fragariaefolia]|uniref:Unnamed protein product n=1 Tax=Phytophthora fragariaefolia TaxID=1490495 RepID=A0A9W6TJA9_9STRA|nr:unnamed protein product [Phytophthora fragariaefolia]
MPRGRRSKKTVSKRYWALDKVEPNAPTSIDVLFEWLKLPGNYQRWRAKNKQPVCDEIVGYMVKRGITHRGDKQVWAKLVKLENSFETATNWLLAKGHHAAFQLGEAHHDVRKQVKKLCRYYDELLPVFQQGIPASAARSESSSKTVSNADASQDKIFRSNQSKSSNETDVMVELCSQSPRLSRLLPDPESQINAPGGTQSQTYDLSLQKLQLESKKSQLRADEICNMALNRKKMLDAGIGLEEVDRVLPLK